MPNHPRINIIKAMSLIAPFWLNEHPQVGRYMCLNSILPLQMPSLSIKPPSEGLVCELGRKMSGGKLKNKLGHLGFEGECWVAYSTFMLSLTYPEGNLKDYY